MLKVHVADVAINTFDGFPLVLSSCLATLPHSNRIMKLSALILLPATALAFAPQQPVSLFPTSRVSNVALHDVRDDFDDVVKKIEDTTEDYVGKADELVINRGMRLANHLPVLVTLKALADKAGMSASINGGIVAVSSQIATLQFGDEIDCRLYALIFACIRPILS